MNSNFTNLTRILLGIMLVFFGLNKFFEFVAPTLAHEAKVFIQSIGDTGYLMHIVGIFEIFIGAMLLFNKWVAFALLMLVPISLNILLFHLFLDLSSIIGALVISTLNLILIYKYWNNYKSLFV